MGLLQQNKAIFYHPLDDQLEYLESKTWAKASGNFTAAKVDDGLSREDTEAGLSGLSADYASTADKTKVAFCGWFREPSASPAQTAAPTVSSPIWNGATSVDGTGVNGAAVTVYVNDVGAGTALVAGGVWTKAVAALETDDTVEATQRSPGELESGLSNEVTVQAVQTAAPTVTSPIFNGATSASGTSSEADGTVIQVYKNGNPHGSTTTVTSGEWTQSGMALATGDTVKAKATASGKSQSDFSNEVTVVVSGFGGPFEYAATATLFNNVVALSDSKVMVAYQINTDSPGYARVGAVSGKDITWGAASAFMDNSNVVSHTPIVALSGTKVVIAYAEGIDSDNGRARVGTVSGTDITWGSVSEFYSAGAAYSIAMALAVLSESKVAVAYSPTSALGKAKVGTVSGLTITWGGESTFQSAGSISFGTLASLGNSKVVVVYTCWDASGHGRAKVGAVSGTGIEWGSACDFQPSDEAYFTRVAVLSETKVVVAWQNNTGVRHGQAKVGTVSGLDITFGAASEFLPTDNTANQAHLALAALSGSRVIVAYEDKADSRKGKARAGTVSGTAIAWGGESTFQSATGAVWNSIAAPTGSKAVVAYADVADSSHGKAKVWEG